MSEETKSSSGVNFNSYGGLTERSTTDQSIKSESNIDSYEYEPRKKVKVRLPIPALNSFLAATLVLSLWEYTDEVENLLMSLSRSSRRYLKSNHRILLRYSLVNFPDMTKQSLIWVKENPGG